MERALREARDEANNSQICTGLGLNSGAGVTNMDLFHSGAKFCNRTAKEAETAELT
jgi:hypothetical protein